MMLEQGVREDPQPRADGTGNEVTYDFVLADA